jgi:hypothetical protein
MIAVGLVSLVFFASLVWSLAARRERFLKLAAEHKEQAVKQFDPIPVSVKLPGPPGTRCVKLPGLPGALSITDPGRPETFFFTDPERPGPFYRVTPLGEWHLRMLTKYHEAAARPWLQVPPDSPPTKR